MMKVSNNVTDLNGTGLEFLISNDGEIIRAEFFDGNMVRAHRKCTTEESERSTVPLKTELDPEVEERLNKLLNDYMKAG